jgi:thiamine biosynthesis lipoprotein
MTRVEHIMGMPIVVAVRDGDVPDDVFDWFRHVDETFSTYKRASEVSRIRRCELALDDASDEVKHVYARCDELREETSGFFDVASVGRDPSGYVKGWAVDEAAAILDRAGAAEYAINAGGDIRTRGWWRVGIQHPYERQAVAKVVEGADLAIATSGAYERGEHVIDPRTGRPPRDVLSVTVVGPDLGTADAYATAAFVMGAEQGARWLARVPGYAGLVIGEDATMTSTPAMDAYRVA